MFGVRRKSRLLRRGTEQKATRIFTTCTARVLPAASYSSLLPLPAVLLPASCGVRSRQGIFQQTRTSSEVTYLRFALSPAPSAHTDSAPAPRTPSPPRRRALLCALAPRRAAGRRRQPGPGAALKSELGAPAAPPRPRPQHRRVWGAGAGRGKRLPPPSTTRCAPTVGGERGTGGSGGGGAPTPPPLWPAGARPQVTEENLETQPPPRGVNGRENGGGGRGRPTVGARERGDGRGRDHPPHLTLTKSSMTGSLSPSFSPLTGTDSAMLQPPPAARLARRCQPGQRFDSTRRRAAPLPSPALRATAAGPAPAAQAPAGAGAEGGAGAGGAERRGRGSGFHGGVQGAGLPDLGFGGRGGGVGGAGRQGRETLLGAAKATPAARGPPPGMRPRRRVLVRCPMT